MQQNTVVAGQATSPLHERAKNDGFLGYLTFNLIYINRQNQLRVEGHSTVQRCMDLLLVPHRPVLAVNFQCIFKS